MTELIYLAFSYMLLIFEYGMNEYRFMDKLVFSVPFFSGSIPSSNWNFLFSEKVC
jgi:FMN-dependent NADH-azoreductase